MTRLLTLGLTLAAWAGFAASASAQNQNLPTVVSWYQAPGQMAPAQATYYSVTPITPTVSYYYPQPTVAYYAPQPVVAYYAPPTRYSFYQPAVTAPVVASTSYYYRPGIFRPRVVANTTYYSPGAVVAPSYSSYYSYSPGYYSYYYTPRYFRY